MHNNAWTHRSVGNLHHAPWLPLAEAVHAVASTSQPEGSGTCSWSGHRTTIGQIQIRLSLQFGCSTGSVLLPVNVDEWFFINYRVRLYNHPGVTRENAFKSVCTCIWSINVSVFTTFPFFTLKPAYTPSYKGRRSNASVFTIIGTDSFWHLLLRSICISRLRFTYSGWSKRYPFWYSWAGCCSRHRLLRPFCNNL